MAAKSRRQQGAKKKPDFGLCEDCQRRASGPDRLCTQHRNKQQRTWGDSIADIIRAPQKEN